MRRRIRLFVPVMVVVLGGAIAACETVGPPRQPQWSPVPISDFRSVAGKWEGLLIRSPRAQRDDWVRLIIREDGAYQFSSYRMIGVFHGSGTLTLQDGRVTTGSEGGTATCLLYEANGQRMLRAHGITREGLEYSAELTPVH